MNKNGSLLKTGKVLVLLEAEQLEAAGISSMLAPWFLIVCFSLYTFSASCLFPVLHGYYNLM